MYKTKAYSAASDTAPLVRTSIPRATPTTCRSRSSSGRVHPALPLPIADDWSEFLAAQSRVPGHEIVGRVTQVGSAVSKWKAGDVVGVGDVWWILTTPVPNPQKGLENFCPNMTLTFNSPDRHGTARHLRRLLRQHHDDPRFVLRVPTNLKLAGAAPLLCAGITTYSAIRRGRSRRQEGRHCGVGQPGPHGCNGPGPQGACGGLYHLAGRDRLLRLGAHEVVISPRRRTR